MSQENGKPKKTKRSKKQASILGISVEKMLLKGPLPELGKMKLEQLRRECEMWRNVWGWVPSEVKYYVARVGQMVGITMRNYKRYLGILLDTHWDLLELELGVEDKVYDVVTGKHFFERKIIKTRATGLMDLQWIKDRVEVEGEGILPSEPQQDMPPSTSTPDSEEGQPVV